MNPYQPPDDESQLDRIERRFELHHGDCLDVLKTLADCSVDAIVTDPPYGLSFMGKRWDYDVPTEAVWVECLRVLKPGGHLLAFAGTRTQHRMAVRIEDAGFEIRDMIAWVYGSGFPKSLDVSKAIDKAAGAERELGPKRVSADGTVAHDRAGARHEGYERPRRSDPDAIDRNTRVSYPATEAAKQWDGWGTALKPAIETVTVASKPLTEQQEQLIIQSNLFQLEAKLWLLSIAKLAEADLTSSRLDYEGAFRIAQWTAEKLINTQEDLCGQMDMSRFELAKSTSLSIALSWRRILGEALSNGSTFTTETKLSTTIDWKTLSFSLSQITPESIIKACSLPGGFSANASIAEKHFNASLLLLQSIRTLSAADHAMLQEQARHLEEGVKPSLDPCIMARKPLIGTVAANVLKHGTGGLNIDGCRVGTEDSLGRPYGGGNNVYGKYNMENGTRTGDDLKGRFPANFIHDGSEEVLALFPETTSGSLTGQPRTQNKIYGSAANTLGTPMFYEGDSGNAARFFYCAKASRDDRDEGCGALEERQTHNRKEGGQSIYESSDRIPSRNPHPTVKPTDLMRYLCRLITPPNGIVLDPFTGSGSTGKAAMAEGFRFIGIEREAEYIEIARARISAEAEKPRQLSLF